MSGPFNPFGGPFGGAPGIGGNPIDDDANLGPRCPKCKSKNFHAWSTDYGVMRKCLEPGCKEEWSGGSVSVSANQLLFTDPDEFSRTLAEGTMAPDIDIPSVQFTGSNFRDPSRNLGGDDEW